MDMISREFSFDRPGQLLAGEFSAPELPKWFQEPGAGKDYIPWRHTPLEPYMDAARPHQDDVRETFVRVASCPPSRYDELGLEELVAVDFLAGMTHRETKCDINYNNWADRHSAELDAIIDDLDLQWLLGEGLDGHGTPGGQLKLLLHAPSLRSLDLQVLTTPFGYRYQHVPAMREELLGALRELKATIYEQPRAIDGHPPRISPDPLRSNYRQGTPDENTLGSPNSLAGLSAFKNSGRGILVTSKLKIAEIPEISGHGSEGISVVERQVWLVLTTKSVGFDERIAAMMWGNPCWQEGESPDFVKNVTAYILAHTGVDPGSIPLSTMTYAYRSGKQVADQSS